MPKYIIESEIAGAGNLSAEEIQKHASAGGFPANSIAEIKSVIDPTTAE